MAFSTSISGIDAAQERMSVISNNIVNAGTVGFKKGSAQFGDLYSSALQDTGSSAGSGVELTRIRSDFTQGEFQFTSSPLDLAIDGSGLFMLSGANGEREFTRAGSFQSDNQGFVVSESGLRLQGYQSDVNGALLPTLGDLQVDTALLAQSQTAQISFSANIDSRTEVPENAFSIDDPTSFNSTSTTTIYDSDGAAHELALYFSGDPAVANTFNVFVAIDDVVQPGTIDLEFDASGQLTPDSATELNIIGYAPANANVMDMAIDLSGVNSFGSSNTTIDFSQDGYPAGELLSFGFDETGTLISTYTNGEQRAQGQVALATFINPESLRPTGGNGFAQTDESGEATVGAPASGARGSIRPSALEMANVDITSELLALIEAQRNFQSNAQSIQALNEASTSILQL
ncbi:flagellar hook protein FlgE [Luminiphilus sp.]|nr:flagellar hook protein FlgE [Luminiphilus sp.]